MRASDTYFWDGFMLALLHLDLYLLIAIGLLLGLML